MKKASAIYGLLELVCGNTIDLEGQSHVTVEPEEIQGYGETYLGDEANVFVEYADGSVETITGIDNVKKFFAEQNELYK